MPPKLLLSVIIVSYNTKELLKDCLDSVQLSTEGIESEIFVVDNNSSDNTTALFKANYKWVKLIENKKTDITPKRLAKSTVLSCIFLLS